MATTFLALVSSAALALACDSSSGGRVPLDTSDVIADTTPVRDTTSGEQDTRPSPTDTSTADTSDPGGCDEVTLTGQLVRDDEFAQGYLLGDDTETDLGFGGAGPDLVSIEFYEDLTGTFDLASGDNDNYASCYQCVVVFVDIGADDSKILFQTGGLMTVDAETPPGDAEMKITLEGLTLTEVTIDGGSYISTPVADGACAEVDDVTLETAACTPTCEANVCGPDGCGGVCGEACATDVCNLTGTACEAATICTPLEVAGPLTVVDGGAGDATVFELDAALPSSLGAIAAGDVLQLEFYAAASGTVDLSSGDNANYQSCTECVRLFVDSGTSTARQFFQSSGSLVLADGSAVLDGDVTATLDQVTLVEVEIDDDFLSTPVAGGACVTLTTSSALTTAE